MQQSKDFYNLIASAARGSSLMEKVFKQSPPMSECPCINLEGWWHNQVGSWMVLKQNPEGRLTGLYMAAVELHDGTVKQVFYNLVGGITSKPEPTIVLAVSWGARNSTSIWVGQYLIHDGEATLYTTGVLKSSVERSIDNWKSVQIGDDIFRRPDEEHVQPTDVDIEMLMNKEHPQQTSSQEGSPGDTSTKSRTLKLDGNWYDQFDGTLQLQVLDTNMMTGTYSIPEGQARKEIHVFGIGNGNEENRTFAFFGLGTDNASVTAWVGQGHLETDMEGGITEILQLSRLRQTEATDFRGIQDSTSYCQEYFNRTGKN